VSDDHDQGAAPEEDVAAPTGDFSGAGEPFQLFEQWLAEATAHERNDPNAMALATVDASGLPNVRMVLLKGVDGSNAPMRGFVFYTITESAKCHVFAAHPRAALFFHLMFLCR
jgi:pyridoxamine 5'-phosphate oxidase